jgi:hypothetical protein
MAQKRQIALNEEARLKIVVKKTQANTKALQKAQQALEKYQTNGNSLYDKDWGDVVRWVLPEAKVEFLLKDLKKKEQMVFMALLWACQLMFLMMNSVQWYLSCITVFRGGPVA